MAVPSDRPARTPRTGWVDASAFGPIDRSIVDLAFGMLLDAGIEPEPVSLPNAEKLFEILSTIQASEAYAEHMEDVAQGAEVIDDEVLFRLKRGAGIFAWQYLRAGESRRRFRAEVASLFETYDLVALPTVPMTAPKIGERQLMVDGATVEVRSALLSLTSPWNLSGTPALTVPSGMLHGLPTGLQLVAPNGREGFLFGAARHIEQGRAGFSS